MSIRQNKFTTIIATNTKKQSIQLELMETEYYFPDGIWFHIKDYWGIFNKKQDKELILDRQFIDNLRMLDGFGLRMDRLTFNYYLTKCLKNKKYCRQQRNDFNCTTKKKKQK